MTALTEVKWTEAAVLSLLRERHAGKGGSGPEWAYLEHVRDAAGFSATRTIDALALHLWPSRGHELHAFEVKVSRGDWRRELADPAKAEGWCALVDRFWIVAPRGVVPRDELPASWGLLETKGESGLAQTVAAPLLRQKAERPLVDRSLLACLLRAAGAGLASTPNAAALTAAYDNGREKGRESAQTELEQTRRNVQMYADASRVDRERLQLLEQALGGVSTQAYGKGDEVLLARARQVAAAVRGALAGDDAVLRAGDATERAAAELERQAAWLRQHAGRHS
ncbi:MAG: hypothetical protein JWP11_3689 [Frankiales bacterium]|nr:hypothetical protein [Frankiales bacterium]